MGVGVSSLVEIADAFAAALEPLQTVIPGLQITPYQNPTPTPPSIDIYPGDPFQTDISYGKGEAQMYWTVRARMTTADQIAGQELLLQLLDPAGGVQGALWDDVTLGGTVGSATVDRDGVSGYRPYTVDPQTGEQILGCEWRVVVLT